MFTDDFIFDLQRFAYIYNESQNPNTVLSGTSGNDSIYNYGSYATIDGGAGNDEISNGDSANYVSINAGAGNDEIFNDGSRVTINGDAGNDTITNSGSQVTINAGVGNDYIDNFGDSVTINADAGDDTIEHVGSEVIINSGTGADNITIYGNANNATINMGAGNDSITNFGVAVSINGDAGSDYILNDYGNNVTILGGKGDDSIYNTGSNILFQYAQDDGNDTVTGFDSTSTLQIISGSIKKMTTKDTDIFLAIGKETIKLAGIFDDAFEQLNIIDQNGKTMTLPAIEINGTDGNDIISNILAKATINAGAGNDNITNYGSDVTINGGTGDDYIFNNGLSSTVDNGSVSINGGTGNDSIFNNVFIATINGGDGDDEIYNEGSNVTINGGDDDDYIYNEGSKVTINGGDGDDSIDNEGSNVTINGGDGDNFIALDGANITINGGAGKDSIWNSGSSVLINTSAGNDYIESFDGSNATINGGDGNDSIHILDYNNVTISGGAGDDSIYNEDGSNVLIKYNSGDGNDLIEGFGSDSTLQISGSAYSTKKSGKDVIVTVGKGKITLLGAADLENNPSLKTLNITGKKSSSSAGSSSSSWKLDSTTATYGTAIKITGVKSLDGISLSGKVVTIAASALNKAKVTISNGYTLALADDVAKPSTKKAWSLSGTTASYNQTTTAGYKLANNVITYTKKATKTLATVTGVKSASGLSVSGKVVTVSNAALNQSKVTISSGYTLALASDVTKPSTKKAWSLSNSTATYKQTTTAGYKLTNNVITYTKKATKTLATVNGVKSTKGFSVSGKTIKLATNSLSKKVSVSGGYAFDFASDYKSAKITGSSSNDTIKTSGANMTITGGKGNDSLIGSKGADVFVYSNGDGNDVITNFDENDKISLKSGAAEISTSGNDVIFTVGKGKITLKKADGKSITYIENGTENIYPETKGDVEYNSKGTTATLKDTYEEDNFTPKEYSDYKNKLLTINASEVKHALKITGNKNANKITGTIDDDTIKGGAGVDTLLGGAGNDELYGEAGNDSLIGGAGDDSLWGGVGSDILTGGKGNDVFCYDAGDGNDIITDYSPDIDIVMILSAVNVGNPIADTSGDVVFKIGTGQITFQNSAKKSIELIDKGGNVLKRYTPV